jgi:hypothetical protein
MNVKNANQLYYIIDFLIEYISNKEKALKDKINFDLDSKETILNNLNNKEDSPELKNLANFSKRKFEIEKQEIDLNSHKMTNSISSITNIKSLASPSNTSINSRKNSYKIK